MTAGGAPAHAGLAVSRGRECGRRRLATMLYAKADRERDPAIRAEWKCIARGYLILANQFERNGCKEIRYASFPRICDIDEEAA
jgi:hypothetical protein